MLPDENDLRALLQSKGFWRADDAHGEVWEGQPNTKVFISTYRIIVTSGYGLKRCDRRFERAAGGLKLAMEFVERL